MDRLGHMRALVTIAKLGSFSAAARELAVTPGMLSKQVKQLEESLEARLLHRTTRGVALTDIGEFYVERAVDILNRIEETEAAVAGMNAAPRGVLRISCPPSFGTHVLTPAIAAFARVNPELRIELGLQDTEPDVIASRLDLLFRLGTLRDSSLIARLVGHAPFVLCAAPACLARCGAPRDPAALAAMNCIVDGSIHPDSRWEFIGADARVAQPVSGNFYSLSTEAVVEAVVEGLGVSYVPRYAVHDKLRSGALEAIVFAHHAAMSLPVHALYSSRQHVAAKTSGFLDFFTAQLREGGDEQGLAAAHTVA